MKKEHWEPLPVKYSDCILCGKRFEHLINRETLYCSAKCSNLMAYYRRKYLKTHKPASTQEIAAYYRSRKEQERYERQLEINKLMNEEEAPAERATLHDGKKLVFIHVTSSAGRWEYV